MDRYKADKDGYLIMNLGPRKETLKNKDGTKIEISYHLLPTCHDERDHLIPKYRACFMKTKHYNKDGKLIKKATGINPNADRINEGMLDFYNKLAEKDEEMRKKGEMEYMTGAKFGFYDF